MLLSLVDSMRCPAHDEESALVLTVEEWAGPRIAEGVLGCPVCHARYQIHRGSVAFAREQPTIRPNNNSVDVVRLAAQLSLTEPGGIVLLCGSYARVHEQLADFVETTAILVDADESTSPTAVTMTVGDRLPFADRVLRAAAIHGSRTTPAFTSEIARCLRDGGRIVAPATTELPSRILLLAADEFELVGEASPANATVPIRRSARSTTL